jgi:hypothetical protein
MAAERPIPRERRPAIWPWLLMPLVVLVVFYALFRVHHPSGTPWAVLWSDATGAGDSRPAGE